MKKISLILFFLIFAFTGQAQNFPYLNASTGNPDFFTDKDTNMYLVHGNRITKLNKNFGQVWTKTYGSMTFRSILLSKTGSMYFIAGPNNSFPTILGKIEADGNIDWMKSTLNMSMSAVGSTVSSATMRCNSLFLNSNNHLLLSGGIDAPGNAALVKLDTAGNLISSRIFSVTGKSFDGMDVSTMNILNESSGVVNLVTLGNWICFECAATSLITFSYSDLADTVLFAREHILGNCTKCSSTFSYGFYRSKTRSDVYYLFGSAYLGTNMWNSVGIPHQAQLGKFTMSHALWKRGYRWSSAPGTQGRSLDEDEKGNIFTVIDNLGSSAYGHYHSGVVRFDSTGHFNGTWTKYISDYNYSLSFSLHDRVNAIHHNRTFFNVAGGGFPANSVITETVSQGLSWSCSATDTVTDMGSSAFSFDTIPVFSQFKVSSMTMGSPTPTVSTVPGFSLTQDLCIYMDLTEQKEEARVIYPNPTHDRLFIKDFAGVTKVSLYDVTGTLVPVKMYNSELDLSDFPRGIYFLRIETNGGIVTKKIVKE